MQSRIYTLIWLILKAAFFWAIWGPNRDEVKENVLSFFNDHSFLCIYYVLINAATFIVFAVDKIKAIRGTWRIREIVLLGLCLIGGGIGGIMAMDLCNHKVHKIYFMFGVPAMIGVHFVLFALVLAGAI